MSIKATCFDLGQVILKLTAILKKTFIEEDNILVVVWLNIVKYQKVRSHKHVK
jgi:hypothetical protein